MSQNQKPKTAAERQAALEARRAKLLQGLNPGAVGPDAPKSAYELAKNAGPSILDLATAMCIKLGLTADTTAALLAQMNDHQKLKTLAAELNAIVQRKQFGSSKPENVQLLLKCTADEIRRIAQGKHESHRTVSWFNVLSILVADPRVSGAKEYIAGCIGLAVKGAQTQHLSILGAMSFTTKAMEILRGTAVHYETMKFHFVNYDRLLHLAALTAAVHAKIFVKKGVNYSVVQEDRFRTVVYSDLTSEAVVKFCSTWYDGISQRIVPDLKFLNEALVAPGAENDETSLGGILPNIVSAVKHYRANLGNLLSAARDTLEMIATSKDDPKFRHLIVPLADLSALAKEWRKTLAPGQAGHDTAFSLYKKLQKARSVSIGDYKLVLEFFHGRISGHSQVPLPKQFEKALGFAYTFDQIQKKLAAEKKKQYDAVIIISPGSGVSARVIRQTYPPPFSVALVYEGMGGVGGVGIDQISTADWKGFKEHLVHENHPMDILGVKTLVVLEQVPAAMVVNLAVDVSDKQMKLPRVVSKLLLESDHDFLVAHNLSYGQTLNAFFTTQVTQRNFTIRCLDHMRGRNDRLYFWMEMERGVDGVKIPTAYLNAGKVATGPLDDAQLAQNAFDNMEFLSEKIYKATVASDMSSFALQMGYDYNGIPDDLDYDLFDDKSFVPGERVISKEEDFISEPLHHAFYDRALKTLLAKPGKDDTTHDMFAYAEKAAAKAKGTGARGPAADVDGRDPKNQKTG